MRRKSAGRFRNPRTRPRWWTRVASDPNAVLDDAGLDAEIEAQHAVVTRAERKRAATVGMFQAALEKVTPLIDAAEQAAARAERDRSAAASALGDAVYDALLAIAAERMQALASEVLLPITRMGAEVVRRVTAWGFRSADVSAYRALIRGDNVRSQRIFQKLGLARHDQTPPGSEVEVWYALRQITDAVQVSASEA